jgi:hypothetical protein
MVSEEEYKAEQARNLLQTAVSRILNGESGFLLRDGGAYYQIMTADVSCDTDCGTKYIYGVSGYPENLRRFDCQPEMIGAVRDGHVLFTDSFFLGKCYGHDLLEAGEISGAVSESKYHEQLCGMIADSLLREKEEPYTKEIDYKSPAVRLIYRHYGEAGQELKENIRDFFKGEVENDFFDSCAFYVFCGFKKWEDYVALFHLRDALGQMRACLNDPDFKKKYEKANKSDRGIERD